MKMNRNIQNIFTAFVNVAPFLLLAATITSAVIVHFDFYIKWFIYLGDILGYSIFTNLVFLKIYHRKSFCNPTKIAVYGLIAMNIVSIITRGTQYYNTMYDILIGFIVFLIIIVSKVKKW